MLPVNAIQREITADILATQIRLERAQKKNVTIILVEGGHDARFFRRFIDTQKASISVCFDREKVEAVLVRLETSSFSGVVAIVDADFDRFLGAARSSSNICWTDQNDVEGMILPTTIGKLLNEYGTQARVEADQAACGQQPLDVLVAEASRLGTIRLVNRLKGLGLKFKDMEYKFTSNTGLEINVTASILYLVNRSATSPDPGIIQAEADSLYAAQGLTLNLCQGHDLVRLLGRGLRRRWGSVAEFDSSAKAKSLQKIIRVAYEDQDFLASDLYQCLRAWENANQPWELF